MTDPTEIYHWRRLDARITTSGQPSEAQLGALHRIGIRIVINLGLHSHEKALPDEAASLAALEINYVHIPVAFDAPTDADFARFCAALSAIDDRPVHVHCIANLRVTAFLYRWLRDVKGVDEAQARALMDSVWRPGGVWAAFVGDPLSIALEHRPPG